MGSASVKGIVFVELLAMAEAAVGERAVDAVLDGMELSTGGAYTAVGRYPCSEFLRLVEAFGAVTGLTGAALQRRFGHWMWDYFYRTSPRFMAGKTFYTMLESVEPEIHIEVRKLHPEAELPVFATERVGEGMRMTYRSPRPLVEFCHGVIEAAARHYGERVEVRVRDVSVPGETRAVFEIAGAA